MLISVVVLDGDQEGSVSPFRTEASMEAAGGLPHYHSANIVRAIPFPMGNLNSTHHIPETIAVIIVAPTSNDYVTILTNHLKFHDCTL